MAKGFALTLSPPEAGNNHQRRKKVEGGCEVHGVSVWMMLVAVAIKLNLFDTSIN
jgi:hypothetical protein